MTLTKVLLFLFIHNLIFAQNWVDAMENPSNNKFEDIVEQFDNYWEGKEITKGSGYKQFRRWQEYWKDRLMEDGTLPPAGIKQLEIQNYLRSQRSSDTRMALTANWTSLGPDTSPGGYAGIGRINSIGFHPTNADIVYAGAAGGGLWQTNDGGMSWFTNTDNLATLGVTGIIVDPIQPNIVYIATGDGDASDNYSVGVLKSTDGGVTFNTTGLNWSTSQGRRIRRMIQDPNDNTVLFAASTNGLYRTTDSGVSWTQVLSGHVYDVEPNFGASSNTFYAAKRDQIFRSTDSGTSWTEVYSTTNCNRINLTTSPANTDYVYGILSAQDSSNFLGFVKSSDSGASYTIQSAQSPNILGYSASGAPGSGQGWYDLAIAMDHVDEDVVYVGGVNTWKTIDGGLTWTIVNHWFGAGSIPEVHADQHVLEFRGTVLWEGNDGGVYKTEDAGTTWTWLGSGMVISQMYRLGVSQTDTKVVTGLQDNGTKLKGTNDIWDDILGGDGMECAIRPDNSNTIYGCIQNGALRRSTNGGNNWTNIQSTIPGNQGGAWITPYAIDPNNPAHIYAGYTELYKSTNQGSSWVALTSNLTGGRTFNIVEISSSNSNYIYAGRTNNIFRTTDGGSTWQTVILPVSTITSLEISPNDPDVIYVTESGYTAGEKVFKSTDGGVIWTNISGSLPNLPANCILYQDGTDNGIYVGMDVGIYYKDDNMDDWEIFTDDLPNVEIREMEINALDNEIYCATYGRGLWKSDIAQPVAPICYAPKDLKISITANNGTITWQAPSTIPANGYQYAITSSQSPPTSGMSSSSLTTVSVTNLSADQDYYCYVRSDCGMDTYSAWNVLGPFRGQYTCGDDLYDSGGASANYGDNESIAYTICPDHPYKNVEVIFNSFNVESNYDALYIHNGDSVSDPIFDSGNGTTSSGFPAGGYYGTTIPGPFTSSHNSGCLTFRFLSDGSVTRSGWDVDANCVLDCSSNVVSTKNDGVEGSLRHRIECAELNGGGSVIFDASLAQDTVIVSGNSIQLENVVTILPSNSIDWFFLKSNIQGPIFEIGSSANLELNQLHIIPIPGTSVFDLDGTITIDKVRCDISGNTIENEGQISIKRNGIFELLKK